MRFLTELELKHKKTTEDEINHFFLPDRHQILYVSILVFPLIIGYYIYIYIYIRMKKITIKIRNS
jgi:hypothetical protein